MIIEYDKILKRWIVWKVEGSGLFEEFEGLSRKACKMYIDKKKRGVK